MRVTRLLLALSLLLPLTAVCQGYDAVLGAEALRAQFEEFAALPGSDVDDPAETNTVSYADECDMVFQAHIDSAGCTTNQAVESLMVVVSNLICTVHSNSFLRKCTVRASLTCLGRHANATQIQAVAPLLLTCERAMAYPLADCVVDFWGLRHAAFEDYKQLIDGDIPELNASALVGTIGRKIAFGGERPTASVTNRYTWLALRDIEKHPWGSVCDTMLFKCWPAYLTSSNRLVALNLCLEQGGMSPSSTNEVLRIRNQLLELPPGTMQMLPTNQFYNIED